MLITDIYVEYKGISVLTKDDMYLYLDVSKTFRKYIISSHIKLHIDKKIAHITPSFFKELISVDILNKINSQLLTKKMIIEHENKNTMYNSALEIIKILEDMSKEKVMTVEDTIYMQMALTNSRYSDDPNTKVGAVIVKNDTVISSGYNKIPRGVDDEVKFKWDRDTKNFMDSKYTWVVHAEQVAISKCSTSLKDSSIYVTLFPCHECAKLISESGIRNVYYFEDKYNGTDSNMVAKRILDSGNINYQKISILKED